MILGSDKNYILKKKQQKCQLANSKITFSVNQKIITFNIPCPVNTLMKKKIKIKKKNFLIIIS